MNGWVVTEHVGRDRIAELEVQLDADMRKFHRLERAVKRLNFDAFSWGVRCVLAIDRRPCRSIRGNARSVGMSSAPPPVAAEAEVDMGALAGTIKQIIRELKGCRQRQENAPHLKPGMKGMPEEDPVVLRAAAQGRGGDREGEAVPEGPQVRRPVNPAYGARCWLVGQVCGDNDLVAGATHAKATALTDDLGFQAANPLEGIAVYRVLICWPAVCVLEANACKWHPHAKERLLSSDDWPSAG